MPHASRGFPGARKFGNASDSACASSSESGSNGIPAASAWSASSAHSPPDSEIAGDARSLGPAAPAEDLEGLDELVEVGDLDRGVPPEHRRERALGADERARVGERRPRRRLRATDLEADDRLAGFRAPAQRVHESVGSAHGLEEEPDRARRGILREERQEVGGVGDRLGPRRHDATQPDAAAQREERVRDRARLAQHCDVTGRGRVLGATVPRRRAAGDEEPHAVRPEEHCVELARASCEPLRGLLRRRARLGSDPGHDERPDARGRRLVERGFDALVVDHEECELGHFGQVGDGRVAAKARDLARGPG